jgi:DNA invertase Pin-like site-specific DNA recombinase
MIFGYVRVSTDGQSNGTSPEEQERKCRAIAALRGAGPYDFQLYRDDDVSGKIPLAERPSGREMLAVAKPSDTIVASKLDRMFRNTLDALQMLQIFKERKIDIILADLSAEPITGEGVGKLVFGLMAMFADFERDRINVRTAEGRRAKRLKGGLVGGKPPYGFAVEGRGKVAMLVPNPAEQEPVRVILDLTSQMKPYRLMKELEARGYRDRLGKPFNLMQIKRVVKYHTETPDAREA